MKGIPWALALLAASTLAGCGDDQPSSGGIDLVPPEVTLLAPEDSAVIATPRSIDFLARATDNAGVRFVQFYFDGEPIGQDATAEGDTFSFHWGPEPLSAGLHAAMVRAFDWANLSVADTTSVTVDLEPPEVTLLTPADGAVIITPRSIEFQARATDNVGVRLVEFYFDGEPVGQDVSAEGDDFSLHWQTEPLSSGLHTAMVRAVDWANLSAADTARVTIQ